MNWVQKIALAASVTLIGGCKVDSGTADQQLQAASESSVAHTEALTVTSDGVVTDTLLGETAIPDNFTGGIVPNPNGLAPTSPDPVGGYRFECSPGQLLNDDPIALPGQPGASHLHQFIGNTGANAASTYASLRSSGNTTCGQANTPLNRSSYWMPAMLDGAGNAVEPDHVMVYYKRVPSNHPACGAPDATHIGYCTDLPNGIRFIFGYNMKTMSGGPTGSWDQWFMNFQCWGSEDGAVGAGTATGTYQTLAATAAAGCPAGARVHVTLEAPTCWDGIHLDTADHRSHVVYATGDLIASAGQRACPADHPYSLPIISYQWFFTTDANFVAGKWHLSSDEMMPGVAAGTTLHMDYFEAWSPTAKATWQQYCINGHLTCSAGDLGNGTMIAGAGTPLGGWTKHQLVPLTNISSTVTSPSTTPITSSPPPPSTQVCPDGTIIPTTQTCPSPTPTTSKPGNTGKAVGRKK